MTLIELHAFGFWMVRKTIRIPLLLINQLKKLMELIATTVYYEGAIGVFLAMFISILGFMVGFISGGVYLECVKEPDTLVNIGDVATFGVYSGTTTAVTIFFYTCWYCFKQEQTELLKKLKDGYDRTI